MIAGSDRAFSIDPRFDSPKRDSLGRYGKAAGFPALSPAALLRVCVMARANWSRIATRYRMRRQGVEDIDGKVPLFAQPPKKPRRKLSKAELREQAAAAFRAWRAGQTSKNN